MGKKGLTPESRESIVIMGMGNILLKDEGVGVHIIRELETCELPNNVRLLDAGTAALDVLQMIGSVEKLIVIDAVKGGGKPGTIYKFKSSDITSSKRAVSSLHQLGFMEALSISERLGNSPKNVIIIGIEPKDITIGLELSPEISQKIPEVIRLLFDMLN